MTQQASILFAGDTHGRFRHLEEVGLRLRPDALVLLGDIQAKSPLEQELAGIVDKMEVWWIHGNHDTDSEADYDNLFGSALADRNLHGRVVEVAGVRIAGLGGIFRGRIWDPTEGMRYESAEDFMNRCMEEDPWRFGLPLRHRSSIFPEDYYSLVGQQADVLVTHEAPSCHPNGFEAIDELARSLGVESVFHGHHHDRLDYIGCWRALGFRAFGIGLRGITRHDGGVVLPGELDAMRAYRQRQVLCT